MITKAIITERVLNTNTYMVRVPYLESAGGEIALQIATLSQEPSISESYKVGDVVFVSFEDHRAEKVVILGKLSTNDNEVRGHANFESLKVSNNASLPKDTTIGGKDVTKLLNKVENFDSTSYQPYTPLAIVIDAVTNINGWILTNFTASLETITIDGHDYTCYSITEDGNPLTEIRALDYMEAMTGVRFVPRYNYEKPKNTYLIFADGSIWKAQYDNTNGLLLFAMPNPLA